MYSQHHVWAQPSLKRGRIHPPALPKIGHKAAGGQRDEMGWDELPEEASRDRLSSPNVLSPTSAGRWELRPVPAPGYATGLGKPSRLDALVLEVGGIQG